MNRAGRHGGRVGSASTFARNMWPFKKPTLPDSITDGGVTARFSRQTEQWELTVEGIDFTFQPRELDLGVFEWARTATPIVHKLRERILSAACERVAGWDGLSTESAEILSVDLSDYVSKGYVGVDVAGDDSWGDLGVTVTLKDGQIIAADAGD